MTPPTPPSRLSPQRSYEIYSQNPASSLEEQIEGARRRVSQLQLKIRQEMGELVVSGEGAEQLAGRGAPPSGAGKEEGWSLGLAGPLQWGCLPPSAS